ncbi:unnamed protein product [Aphanomyces euteiches]|uniref:Succinate dehydrogenase [ubiquinone] cytochrome b small subunit n=1 Tax=Aphanomyces euteiches TaxID=100861 RepID=A0A6G0X8T0_9STRA|nr:hypothetical protein Ae201684_007492 [Aphanomyces euteiches]KAH9100679.1 hypothetical protein Ae201684P_006874 [Aphanomyces euteiches]KAH9115068.1 hypothetical protein AeMF1_010885 [Aphanomyces euteiches]KAH9123672.1 hypothetical protein LEN26_009858 [Aphanomyces euteiches]KAH9144066.1 hypothetical protein LEN26_005031 [Aphanomyces euteiches]
MFARVSSQVSRRAAIQARGFRKGTPTKFTENKADTGVNAVLNADNSVYTTKAMHLTSLALLALVPTAVVLSPSALNVPVDYALAALIPIHGHIGLNGVLSDYLPKNVQGLGRVAVLGVSVVTFVGLLSLNITGAGITESVKAIWIEPPSKKEEEH